VNLLKIIIIGAGKVGCQIAKTLSSESHDVILIEKDNTVRQSAQNSLDVLTILGKGANVHTLEESGIKQADMLIAVTNSDKANILACMTAKQYSVPKKVARIRNIEYIHNNALSREQLGIDFVINPEIATAKQIVKLLKSPINVAQAESFAGGKMQLLELKIEEDFSFINQRLKDIKFEYPILVAAIFRKDKIIIPDGEEKIVLGDNLYVLIEKDNLLHLKEFYKLIHPQAVTPIRLGDKVISEDVIRNITGFFFLYILIFVICTFIMSLLRLDILSAMASVAATLGNVGPGLGLVGPAQNYAFIPPLGKITLILCMLLGRLEIYTVLILVVPEFWRK